MEKRRVLKKGRVVITRKGDFVLKLANNIVKKLKPYCKKIEIVGSIRRGEKEPIDIDIVVIPKNKQSKGDIEKIISKNGKLVRHGEKVISYLIEGVKIEIYYTDVGSLGAALFSYTGPSGLGIGMRMYAKKKGLKLNQYGLFKDKKKIAGKTEKEIYDILGKEYKKPEKR